MTSTFCCPDCRRVSHNPNDIAESFCGRCCRYFPAARLCCGRCRAYLSLADRGWRWTGRAWKHDCIDLRRGSAAPLN